MQEMIKEGLVRFVPLAPLMAALGIMLSLSLMVERFLEIFAWIIERLNLVRHFATRPPEGAVDATIALQKQASAEDALLRNPPDLQTGGPESDIPLHPDRADAGPNWQAKPYEPGQPVKLTKEFWLQLSGMLVAVGICIYSKFSIWGLVEWLKQWAAGRQPDEAQATALGMVFTGIIIGAGSKPVHFLMNFLLKRKIVITRETLKKGELAPRPGAAAPQPSPPAETPPAAPAPSPAALPSIEAIVGVQYDGGYLPQRLEYTHQRTRPIDMIVYHHTAMHSQAPLEAIIEKFEQRGWLTSYHAVVFADGGIHPICRWDRIGNHARGYNDRSLGLALHGNFETDPAASHSNPHGEYGPSVPTSEQLHAAARLIALWIHLYDLPRDIKNVLVPHGELANTACPGSRFPHDALQELARSYYDRWTRDDGFQTALKAFKRMPMV